ncbi:MAG TPA: ABC transporter permease [Terracidiphilus sp.]|nr:ABC transporter permease [Terracidiphilus sp.]
MQPSTQDLRYALRQLVRNPRFTLTAVISLALGIGATTAVFSVIYAALLNPYPYPTADRIVRLSIPTKASPNETIGLNGAQVMQVQQLQAVQSVIAMDYQAMTVTGREFPENVNKIGLISTGFDDLGLPPILGRGIEPSDAIPGHDPNPVVVLSFKFWQKHFFGDRTVLGKTLQLDHKSYTIVGVAAPRFIWYSADVYLPLKLTRAPETRLMVDLLLRPGITKDQADAQLQPLLERFAKDNPKQFPDYFKVHVEGLNAWVVRQIGATLYMLLGGVALLLAIGCGNVSILLLVRGAARQQELAVRSALGAKRRRIVRQLLTESLILAGVGAGLGVALAYGILAGIRLLLPRYAFAPEVVIRINLPVLLFSVGVALATGIAFGLWPALRLSRPAIGQMAQSGTRRVAGSVHGRRTQDALIAGQIALTLLLLTGAGSAIEGFTRMLHEPLGYDPHNVMSAGIPLHEGSYATWAARAAYFEQLRARIGGTPGVTMASISTNATPPDIDFFTKFEMLGKTDAGAQMASVELVGPGYFPTLRIPLFAGRIWSETENQNGALVAVINRTMAQRYFPQGNAIGSSLKLPEIENRPPDRIAVPKLASSWLTIVGIVGDSLNNGLRRPIRPAVYLPYTLYLAMGTQILIRTRVPPLTLVHAVRKQISAVNSDQQAYGDMEDLETWISDEPEWQQEHLVSWIFSGFAGLALLLAAVGLYSVVSDTVAQRTNEFGIRMALGAPRGHVLRIVFASTLASLAGGILAGIALIFTLNRIVAKWVAGNAHNPIMLLAGTLILVFVAAIACTLPALRASKIDPMTALRCE